MIFIEHLCPGNDKFVCIHGCPIKLLDAAEHVIAVITELRQLKEIPPLSQVKWITNFSYLDFLHSNVARASSFATMMVQLTYHVYIPKRLCFYLFPMYCTFQAYFCKVGNLELLDRTNGCKRTNTTNRHKTFRYMTLSLHDINTSQVRLSHLCLL